MMRHKFSSLLDSNFDAAGFLGSITEVYKSTPDSNRGLRDIAAHYARVNLSKIQTTENSPLFNDICKCVPEFAINGLHLFAQARSLGRCSNCGPNQKMHPLQARYCGTVAWVALLGLHCGMNCACGVDCMDCMDCAMA